MATTTTSAVVRFDHDRRRVGALRHDHVSAAASLTEAFDDDRRRLHRGQPGRDGDVNFDSSSILAKQILDGAPADVFASADEANMKKLTDAGAVAGTPIVFARN